MINNRNLDMVRINQNSNSKSGKHRSHRHSYENGQNNLNQQYNQCSQDNMGQQGGMTQQGPMGQQGGMGQQSKIGQQGSIGSQGGMAQQGNMGQQVGIGQQGNMGQQVGIGQQSNIGQHGSIGSQGGMAQQGNMGQQGGIVQQDNIGQSTTTFNGPISGLNSKTQAQWDAFMAKNPNVGYVKMQVSTAGGVLPVPDAKVTITKELGNNVFTLYILTTDVNGQTLAVPLPAPDSSLSQTPDNSTPYSTYTIAIEHPKYQNVYNYSVPVFDGITSIQPVVLLPDTGISSPEFPTKVIQTEPELSEKER